jgi:hypothetical protein
MIEDANQEIVAHLRMLTDAYDRDQIHQSLQSASDENNENDESPPSDDQTSGADTPRGLGSPEGSTDAYRLEEEFHRVRPAFKGFEHRLRTFFGTYYPHEPLESAPIKVRCEIKSNFTYPSCKLTMHKITPFKCLYLRYQSLEDWREYKDILRCSSSFHGSPRYDSVILNTSNHPYGRLEGLFRCRLPSGTEQDLALVQTLIPSRKWKPKTMWKGCTVLEEAQPMILSLEYLVRGVLIVDAAVHRGKKYFYRDDVVDNDLFLRFGN